MPLFQYEWVKNPIRLDVLSTSTNAVITQSKAKCALSICMTEDVLANAALRWA